MTRSSRGWRLWTAFAACLIVVAGCAPGAERNDAPKPVDAQFLAMLRTVKYDYDHVASPKALASLADIVVVGQIRSVADGRIQMADSERPLNTAVFAVTVSDVLAGSRDGVVDGQVYFEVLRPGKLTIEEIAKRLPAGEVVLFLTDHTQLGGVENASAGRPSGARIYAPYAQGFWIGDDASAVSVYVDDVAELPDGWHGIDTVPELVSSLAE